MAFYPQGLFFGYNEAMTTPLPEMLCCLGGFALGSIPFGFLAGRLRGVDLKEHGSGNIGATNTIRTMGKTIGLTVFALDVLKGYLPILAAQLLKLSPAWWIVAVGLCGVLGHIYSPWVRFKGGKGVATSLGVLFGLSPLIAVLTLATFVAALFVSGKRVSVGSLAAALGASIMFWTFPNTPMPYAVFTTLASLFILFRHRDNIKRLIKKEEKPLF
jgi:acyl phosphate:glycerol-3-phosphate acyltransferase